MFVWIKRVFLSVAILGLWVTAAATAQERPAAPNAAPIRLQAGTFVPGLGEAPNLPPGLEIADPAPGIAGDYIVQFDGPVGQAQRGALAGLGGRLLGYLPDFAFKVRMTPEQADAADALAGVAWTGLFHPAYKMSPELLRNGPRLYRVMLERGADAEATADDITGAGAQIIRRGGNVAVITAMGAQLDAIAHIMDVAWIENYAFPERQNEIGGGVIMGANTAHTSGYDGTGQIVAVTDTGIGNGTAGGAHVDIPVTRIAGIADWSSVSARRCYDAFPDGSQDVDSGHGTHVAVSVLGGGNPAGIGTGTAPGAHLFFQSVEDYIKTKQACRGSPSGYYLTGLPDDIRDILVQAYAAGARVQTNSWGTSSQQGNYTADSANLDDYIWTHPNATVIFSAGNSGDANNDGVFDNLGSVTSPATAKNAIAVGASENNRPSYDCDYTLAQPSDNTCTNSGDTENAAGTLADNPEQMAYFSSRGPTDDGRIKPDVIAPGTWILSGYSEMYQSGDGGDTDNPRNGLRQWNGWGVPRDLDYKYMGGTSMAAPLVAGAAAVVRQYYQSTDTHDASAALVKARLINSAVDMLDENNDGVDDNDFPIPNDHEGWGRVDLAAAIGAHDYVDDAVGVATGEIAPYAATVSEGGPLRITLVWSDAPALAGAGTTLVNDLDLVVTDGTTTYLGNDFSGGWSTTGGSADNTNNVENVYISSADTGIWTVEVHGYNVPNGPQPFALVVEGGSLGTPVSDTTAPAVMITVPDADPFATGSSTVDLGGTASDDVGVTGVTWVNSTGGSGTATGTDTWSINSIALVAGANVITVTAHDGAGNTSDDVLTVNYTAAGDTTAEVAYATQGGKNQDKHLIITVTPKDAAGSLLVDGVVVSLVVEFQLADGSVDDSWTGEGTTTSGSVTLSWNSAPHSDVYGCYFTTNVTVGGTVLGAADVTETAGGSDLGDLGYCLP